MPLKPWYKVIDPRDHVRKGTALETSEFAVHLDQVRDGRAAEVYRNPEQFFSRTYLTRGLIRLAPLSARPGISIMQATDVGRSSCCSRRRCGHR